MRAEYRLFRCCPKGRLAQCGIARSANIAAQGFPFVPVGADEILVIRGRDGNGQKGCVAHLGNAPQNRRAKCEFLLSSLLELSPLSPARLPLSSSGSAVFGEIGDDSVFGIVRDPHLTLRSKNSTMILTK